MELQSLYSWHLEVSSEEGMFDGTPQPAESLFKKQLAMVVCCTKTALCARSKAVTQGVSNNSEDLVCKLLKDQHVVS